MASNDNMIAALLRERDGYVSRGLKDRVGQVDEQLEHLGYTGEATTPKGRSEAPKQTADQGKAPAKKTAAKKTAASTPPAPPASPETPPAPPAE